MLVLNLRKLKSAACVLTTAISGEGLVSIVLFAAYARYVTHLELARGKSGRDPFQGSNLQQVLCILQ